MGILYEKFLTNEECESEGIWLDYGVAGKFRVARAGGANKRFLKAAERFNHKYKGQIQNETIDRDVEIEAAIQIYADTIITDWEDIKDKNDELLACTRDNKVKILRDLPDLFIDIQRFALKHQNYLDNLDEAAAKNSSPSSSTSSSTGTETVSGD